MPITTVETINIVAVSTIKFVISFTAGHDIIATHVLIFITAPNYILAGTGTNCIITIITEKQIFIITSVNPVITAVTIDSIICHTAEERIIAASSILSANDSSIGPRYYLIKSQFLTVGKDKLFYIEIGK